MVTNTCIHTSVTHQFGVLFLQGAAGAGFATHAALDKKTEDSQAKLRHAQSSLERWQQSLADLVPSSSGRLDAETVRSVPAHIWPRTLNCLEAAAVRSHLWQVRRHKQEA